MFDSMVSTSMNRCMLASKEGKSVAKSLHARTEEENQGYRGSSCHCRRWKVMKGVAMEIVEQDGAQCTWRDDGIANSGFKPSQPMETRAVDRDERRRCTGG